MWFLAPYFRHFSSAGQQNICDSHETTDAITGFVYTVEFG